MTMSHAMSKRRIRAFTLIEIMVVVSIIIILGVILLTVGGSVRRKSQESATRAELQSLEGLIEQFEKDNNHLLPATLYTNSSTGFSPVALKSGNNVTFVDALYAYPATRDVLVKVGGDNLKLGPSGVGSAILDSFGRPISFLPQGYAPSTDVGGGWSQVSVREYLRSSGPDQTTNWSDPNALQNADDILSYEAAH